MPKSILFVIGSLQSGGAEKSLVSLLNALPKDKYAIDLILKSKDDFFFPQVPVNVHIIKPCTAWCCLSESPTHFRFYLKTGMNWWIKKIIRWQFAKRNQKYYSLQDLWRRWKADMVSPTKSYDVAIGYSFGFPNYYVIDCVKAKKKLLWGHSDYDRIDYTACFDSFYFKMADNVITISEICRSHLIKNFPQLKKSKFIVLENISNGDMIRKMSQQSIDDEVFNNCQNKRIVSVGRLAAVKNYSLALRAAAILRKNMDFTWFIIGEGSLRSELEKERNWLGLQNEVHFLGVKKNPYYYMAKSDCFVMSSTYEGKSIAIDEAKILRKPIVSTNYPTVSDNIVSEVNGLITELNAESLASGIYRMLTDDNLRNYITENLNKEKTDNTEEVEKYMALFDS